MTNRTFFLLLMAGFWLACGAITAYAISAAPIPRDNFFSGKLLTALMFFTGASGFYCVMLAFSKQRVRFESHNADSYTQLSCPWCDRELNFSRLPAFKTEFPCPECGKTVSHWGDRLARPFHLQFAPPPVSLAHELASGDGPAPGRRPTTSEVRAALAALTEYVVTD